MDYPAVSKTREYQSDQSSRILFSNELNYLMINMRKKIYCSSWGRHIRNSHKSLATIKCAQTLKRA
ncbi:hypothetical protein BWD14_14405 [Leptospira santarosai]|uniref:Uncharacterized protein n=1 Tax=Leptospira santarosai TaxID=28183 RepID=A0AB73MXL3_9LEPT|nr:hypothetical protein BWD14_14405 [Leptospira santarosai]